MNDGDRRLILLVVRAFDAGVLVGMTLMVGILLFIGVIK